MPTHPPVLACLARLVPVLALAVGLAGCDQPPERPEVERSVWLEQNWTAAQRSWFHHASQGTATLPLTYDWFLALEQPRLVFSGDPGLFSDPAYLRRWGFIDSPRSDDNPGGLPVGFALTADFRDPASGRSQRAIGFTCAACHTGQFTYKGTRVLVDGAPAMTGVTAMGEALGLAAFMTRYVPGRFERFARRVLGSRYSDATRAALERDFDAALDFIKQQADLVKASKAGGVEEGFTRLDALTRIGNQVFGVAAGKDANYVATAAPVNYPHIWNTSWFTWVQYDGSIMQPMVRNAGEALGVAAGVALGGPEATRFESTVRFRTLHRIEQQLAGAEPPLPGRAFSGLRSPKWPEDVLGAIDTAKAAAGRALYVRHCEHCHLPAPDTEAFWDERHWVTLGEGERKYLNVNLIPLAEIGTDPAQARALNKRTVDTSGIGVDAALYLPDARTGVCAQQPPVKDGPAVPYGLALGAVVQQTIERWYAQNAIPPEQQQLMNGNRPNCLNPADVYRARPLNGVWATAPFLHNGSVPTLLALLSPHGERPSTFWLGHLEFDPKSVGLVATELKGGTRIDTTQPGNSNRGHEFDDAPKGTPGVIGPRLTPDERAALVEFLKTL